MRLRLNTTLRAALIAAITTVGYTLGVACAGIQSTDISLWNGYQEDSGSAIVGNTGSGAEFGTIYTGGQTWNSQWSCVVTVDTATLLAAAKPESVLVVSLSQNGGESKYAEAATLTGDNDPTVALTTWTHANAGSGSLTGLDAYKDLTFVMSRPSDGKITLKVYADGKFSETPLFTATEGTGQSFGGTVITSMVTGGSGGGAKGSNTKLPNDADVGSYSVLAAGYTLGALPSTADLNHYYTGITNILNWNGTSNSEWSSTAANWLKKGSTDPVAFTTPYAQAVFGKDGGLSKSVTVTEDVTVSTMTVEDNYALVLNANVAADTIRIKSGASLSYSGSGTLSGALDGQGAFTLASGAKSMPGSVTAGGNWTGTVEISGAAFTGDLTNVNSMGNANSWVALKGTSGWAAGTGTINANLILEKGANDWAFQQNNGNDKTIVSFTGKIKGDGKLGRSNDKGSTYTYAFSGDISGWNGTFESRSKTDHSTTFRVSDNATAVNAALVNASGNLNVDVQTSATFGASVNATKLTVAADKTATFNGATTFANGLIMEEGASVIVGATGSLNLGGAVTFGHQPIDVLTGGSVTLNADTIMFDLDGLTAADSGSKYTYTLFTAGVNLAEQGITVDNITMSSKSGKVWEIGTDGTISYTMSSQKVWTAGVGDWDYVSTNWNDSELFTSESVAVFNTEAIVTVKGDVEATAIDLQNGAWVMLGADNQAPASLSSGSIALANGSDLISSIAIDGLESFTVAEGASWAIGAEQELGAGTNNGTITVLEDGVARLTNASNATDLLLGIEGEGNISLATDVSIAGGTEAAPTTSKATGKLIVEEGKKLTIGSGKGTYVNLTSFSGIELGKNANLETNVATTALRNLTVGEGSHTIHLSDTADYNKVALDLQGTTTLNGDLKLTSGWKYNVNIAALVGTGGLELTGGSESHKVVIGDAAIKTINVGDNMTEVQLNGTVSLTDNLTLKRGTTKVTGTTSVGGQLDLSKGGESNATLTITEGATVNVASTFWGHSGSHLNIEKGGALNLNSDKLGLVGLEGGGSITSPSNKDYSAGNADFTLSGVAITAKDNVTIGNKLDNSSVITGAYAVTVNNANNTIAGATVGEGGSLSMTEGTLFSVIESGGSVTLTGTTLDKDSFIEQGGETGSHYDLNGQLTDGDNYYLGTSEKYLTVVNGGTSATGTNLTWGDATDLTMTGGKVVTEAGEVVYETFYVNADSVNVSDILANDTTAVQVNAGTLVVNQDATGVNITVTEFGTISGDYANAAQVGIASEALAQYTQDVEVSGVKFTPANVTGAVLIYNAGEQTKVYGTDDSNMSVSAKKLEMTKQDGDVTVSNAVYVNEIVNTTTHALTLDNVEDTLELVNMDITNSTVKVYTNLAQDTEATVSISGVLQGGEATLLANLTLVGGADSMLDVDGGADKALTLGSKLTIDTTDGLVNLDQDTINALAGLSEGQWLDLIVAADQTKLNYGGSYEGVSYDTLFSATGLTGPYTVYANEGSFGLVKGSQVPEPTTGTLSLLALAALAARRRRK